MKIHIDFSLFTESGGAFGNVHGKVEFAVPPQVGDTVLFQSGKPGVVLDPRAGFLGLVRVETRLLAANPRNDDAIMLSLADVTVPTPEAARILADYMERAFDLFVDVYDER